VHQVGDQTKVIIFCLLYCILGIIQATKGRKDLPQGPHFCHPFPR